MTTRQESTERSATGRRLLVSCVIGMLAAAVGLWAASSLVWTRQRYRTPFSGDDVARVTGEALRPELAPLALATLAAIAAVLATGGLLRRVIGLVIVLEAVLLGWRLFDWLVGPAGVSEVPGSPPGSRPLEVREVLPYAPALMGASALVLLLCGAAVLFAARRMPAMGSKYSAPAEARETRDPDRRLWEDLDEGRDPTEAGDGDENG
ncbi:Trp biosynthesis-associated membrane protein [Actinopolyspora xinjiangensis]|uniref:Trp biosynthesis-associated membrane protein n=1 Tax=Actinopolyspora xinjiangensis TaxID=405564 RepID=UPI000B87F5A3|nr:Trp biosynthesis-associated membrane protein [Actinopolyspora xinjiangensis]